LVGVGQKRRAPFLDIERDDIMAEKSRRGFAGMDPAKQREIASKGGKAAHAKGTAHEFTPEEARAAGRKGGQAAHMRGTAHQFTPEEAREAGRKGGRSSRRNAAGQQPRPAETEENPPEHPPELQRTGPPLRDTGT
jgi:general stress protein YciG